MGVHVGCDHAVHRTGEVAGEAIGEHRFEDGSFEDDVLRDLTIRDELL